MNRALNNVLLLSVLGGLALTANAGGEKGESMDTNGDGMISASEHAAGAQAKFERMDADRDGQLTAAEMEGAHAGKGMAGKRMDASGMMGKMDGDADGRISASEHATAAQSMFDEADTNDDGNLSQEEWKAHHEMKMDHAPAGQEGGGQ